MTHYEDKQTEFAAYRMFLLGINVAVMMAAVLVTAVCFPDISQLAMCTVCFVLILASLIFQLRLEYTTVLSGQFLIEDGEILYVVAGIFGLGFGKKHHQNKRIRAYRYYSIEHVKSVKVTSFGIRVAAEVWTATNAKAPLTDETFDTPGEARRILTEHGKRKKKVFRIEHNLLPSEEKRLLQTLKGLS